MPSWQDFQPFIVAGLALGGVYALSGVGMVVLYRATGVLNLSFGAVGAMGAFIAYSLIHDRGVPEWLGYAACIAFGGIVTLVYGVLFGPPLAGRDPLVKAVATSTAVAYLHPAVQRGNAVEVLTDTRVHRILVEGARGRRRGDPQRAARDDPRRARGDPLCRRLPLAAAVDALRRRARGRPRRRAGRVLPRPARRPRPAGPPDAELRGLHRQGQPDLDGDAGGVRAVRGQGRGPITSNGGEGGAFVRTRDGLDAPDVQFHMGGMLLHEEFLGVPFDDAYTFGPAVVKPSSRGRVTLRSPVPHARPRIVHNYLQADEDRRSLIAGVRLNLEIHAAPALREWRRSDFLVPKSDSEDDIMDFVQRRAHTVYHPVGTCAMGSVVDAELRVLGLEGLRVVDASVMPAITRGNTNAPTIMIGEKGADLIRGRAPLPREEAAPVRA